MKYPGLAVGWRRAEDSAPYLVARILAAGDRCGRLCSYLRKPFLGWLSNLGKRMGQMSSETGKTTTIQGVRYLYSYRNKGI